MLAQGNIAAWRKNEGDAIAPGEVLAEVETDKATIEWEAQEEGYVAKILKPAGVYQLGATRQGTASYQLCGYGVGHATGQG